MEQQPEEQEFTPVIRRRGRPKKAREEEGGVLCPTEHPPEKEVVTPNVTPQSTQPLPTGFWMGLLTTQREMELETRRDRYKRFSIA